MRQKLIWLVLLVIIIFAAVIRLHDLSSVPPSPYLDEVSNGYNAYSILKTGNDEYGKHLPILMQAYNDFRPTLFVYFMIPFIATFGLNTFAIRLPAVILSVLTTLSIFFLTKFLLGNPVVDEERTGLPIKSGMTNIGKIQTDIIALLAAFLFAISPWSIYSSHISDEINMSLSFFVFGMTFFLLWRNKNHESRIKERKNTLLLTPYFSLLVSIVFFVLAFYAYHGIKVFLPVFILCLGVIYWKELWLRKRMTIAAVLLATVLLVPLALAFSEPGTFARLGGVDTGHPELVSLSAQRILYDQTHLKVFGKIFDNRRLLFFNEFVNDYLRNFDPTWLFLPQENVTYLVPNVGPMYLFELPLLLLGIYFLLKDKFVSKKVKSLFVVWILASPLPAALSSESPHLNRSNTLLPALIILEAIGLWGCAFLLYRYKNIVIRVGGLILLAGIVVFSFFWFWQSYFVEFPYEQSKFYQYGSIQAFAYVHLHEAKYAKIIVSNTDTLLESYMYYLFATQYDPATYQKNGGTHSAFFTDTHVIGKYDFRNPNLYEPKGDNGQENVLYIVNPGEVSPQIVRHEQLHSIRTFQFLNGKDAIWIMEGKI